jgi:hypothetical protein
MQPADELLRCCSRPSKEALATVPAARDNPAAVSGDDRQSIAEAPVAQLRTMVGGAVALAASAVLAGPAAAIVGARQIVDGCELGGGGNDIHSLQSHYDADRKEIIVTLRLCSAARRNATYRVHLDHAAPFVEEAGGSETCATPEDSVAALGPGAHKGVGASEVQGNLVRFVVPLDDLDAGAPEDVPLIPLWATSTLRGTVDRAPTPETGDDCAHPQARTETLVQPLALTGNVAFISSALTNGFIGATPAAALAAATILCQQDAPNAGITDTDGIIAWLSNSAGAPIGSIPDPEAIGPIQTADGTTVAETMADLLSCDPSGNNECLLASIDEDINGNEVPFTSSYMLTWTNTLPSGAIDVGPPNSACNDWTSNSEDELGFGGFMGDLTAAWTTGPQDTCDQTHPVICFQTDVLVPDG